MNAEKLLRMKEKADKIDIEIAKLQGRLDDRKKQLEKETGKAKMSEAKSVLKKLKTKIDHKKSELEKGIKELEEKYEW